MSHKEISKGNNFLTCENYVSFNNKGKKTDFLEIAFRLKIVMLVIDDLTIKEQNSLLESADTEEFSLTTSKLLYETLKSEISTSGKLKIAYKNLLYSNDGLKCLLVTRKTICENSVDVIKKQLGSFRNQYEIISLNSKDRNTLKWAAQDRRIDYISVELLGNSEFIDQSLCSVMKQNNKVFEIVLSSLINTRSDRELSEILRKGKKLMKLIRSTNTPFIFTMKPGSPLELRTGSQMRLLGSLLDSSYNKTKICVFDKQLEILIANTIKLHESHIFEGIKEV
ncbi:MAG: RNase P subunit p30 family protein [Candidatus Heimdallarchaeaceae archaeon]